MNYQGCIEEKPVRFTNQGLVINGFIYPGNKQNQITEKQWGYVFCDPFAEEKKSSLRVYVDFARLLQKMGCTVLRFDYRCCGDSEGVFKMCTISSMCSDIYSATEFLKEKYKIKSLGLLGLRLSTKLILKVLPGIKNISQLILWEPILNIEKHFRQILRRQLIKDLITFGRVKQSRDEMIQKLDQHSSIDFEGYELGHKLFIEIKNMNDDISMNYLPYDILLLNLSKTGSETNDFQKIKQNILNHNPKMEAIVIKSLPIWNNQNIPITEQLFDTTSVWINSHQNKII